jgi:hypothetical protein
MKKITIFMGVLLFYTYQLKAQHVSNFIEDPDTLFFQEDAFVNLDTSSLITTGYLWDRTPYHVPLIDYKGHLQQDSLVNVRVHAQTYFDLLGAAVAPSNLPTYDSLQTLIQQLSLGYNAIPIMTMNYTINSIKSDAFSEGYLQFNNGILDVVPGENPFEEMHVFMAGGLAPVLPVNDTFYFVAPLILHFKNQGDWPDSIFINFHDESGWQWLEWNEPKAFYLTSNDEEIEYTIKVVYPSNEIYFSKNTAFLKTYDTECFPSPDELPCGITGKVVTYPITYISFPSYDQIISSRTRFVKNYFEAQDSYLGHKGHGKVYIRYGKGNTEMEIRKPIILVEGIDFGKGLGSIVGYDPHGKDVIWHADGLEYHFYPQCGSFGWPQLFNCDAEGYPSDYMPHLMDSLYEAGYDVMLLDFFDGADYMQRNGLLLKHLINEVNACKTGTDDIVLFGISMGGQVARWTLLDMESNNEPHCVRLFVSHDSPWQGATIPASIQYFVKYSAYTYNNADAIAGIMAFMMAMVLIFIGEFL